MSWLLPSPGRDLMIRSRQLETCRCNSPSESRRKKSTHAQRHWRSAASQLFRLQPTNRSAIARCSSATLTATCWKSTQRSFRSLTVHKQTLAEATRSVVALLADPIKINDGMLTARGPGLGLDWNETAVSKYLV